MKFRKILKPVVLTIAVINMTGCESKEEKITSALTECAEKYGLKDVVIEIPELRSQYKDYIDVYASNYKEIEWDVFFEMYKEMNSKVGFDSVDFKEKNKNKIRSYSVLDDPNIIIEYRPGITITYYGNWESFIAEDSVKYHKKVREKIEDYSEKLQDEQIGKRKCVICSKESTKRIDNEYYCDEHYKDAKEYYSNQSKND